MDMKKKHLYELIEAGFVGNKNNLHYIRAVQRFINRLQSHGYLQTAAEVREILENNTYVQYAKVDN